MLDIDRIAATDLQPDDVILIYVPNTTTADEADRIYRKCHQRFPGHRAIVLTSDMTVEIVRPNLAHLGHNILAGDKITPTQMDLPDPTITTGGMPRLERLINKIRGK